MFSVCVGWFASLPPPPWGPTLCWFRKLTGNFPVAQLSSSSGAVCYLVIEAHWAASSTRAKKELGRWLVVGKVRLWQSYLSFLS